MGHPALPDPFATDERRALAELTAEKLSYGHSAGKVETKAEFIDAVASKKTIVNAAKRMLRAISFGVF